MRISDEDEAQDGVAEGGMGPITGTHRDTWTLFREELLSDENADHNKPILEMIDSSILVVALDDKMPSTPTEQCRVMLTNGDGVDRWFDKLTLIGCKNGELGWNMEHAPYDGHTLLNFTMSLWQHICGTKLLPTDGIHYFDSVENPELQTWKLSLSLRKQLMGARQHVFNLNNKTQISCLELPQYGGSYIKKQGISPDGYVQMAYQVAYYRMMGHQASTYESAMTKRFYHGRTECLRSASKESKTLCEAFSRPFSLNSVEDVKSLYTALKTAADRHVKVMELCKTGKGVDRHLLGLHSLALQRRVRLAGYQIPAFFEDPTYPLFCRSVLSTSNCGSEAFKLFGFGPVCSNGLGLGYMIKEKRLDVTITSFINRASRFETVLKKTLLDFKEVCDAKQSLFSESPKARL